MKSWADVEIESIFTKRGAMLIGIDYTQEYSQLKALAAPKRLRVWIKDGEPYMPGHLGNIEPYSLDGSVLAASTEKPVILGRMLKLPFVKPHQVCDGEGSVTFPVKHFDEMVAFLKIRKKNAVPSPEQIEVARQRMLVINARQRGALAG